jgi:hypothetical protein
MVPGKPSGIGVKISIISNFLEILATMADVGNRA